MSGATGTKGGRTACEAGVGAGPTKIESGVQVGSVQAGRAHSVRAVRASEGDRGAGIGGDAQVELKFEPAFAGVAGDSKAGGAMGGAAVGGVYAVFTDSGGDRT